MPIYLTRTTNFRTKVEAYERRGLENQASAKISELSIVPVSMKPLENVIRYSNLSTELEARLNGSAKFYDSKPRAVLRRFSGEAPFESPTLIVEMKSGGEALHPFGMFEAGTGKQGLYGGQPTVEQFTSIANMGIDFYQNTPAGNVNIAGYVAFLQAWRGVRAFYAVGGGEPGEAGPLMAQVPSAAAKLISAVEEKEAVVNEKGELVKEGRPGKEGGGNLQVGRHLKLFSGSKIAVDGIPFVATDEEDLDFKGLLFPYFKEMLEPDVDFAYGVFIELYQLCLEDEEGPTAEAVTVHRRGFRYLANTAAGRIIQHVYLGIKLSIAIGSGLVLIKDGADYGGFILKGEGFRVAVQNRVFTARSEKELSAELAALDIHNKALRDLFDLLLAIGRVDGKEEQIDLAMLKKNPRFLREMIQARGAGDIDEKRKEIADLVEDLKYQQVYWEVNAVNLSRFLEKMVTKAPMIDEPMYVQIDVLCNRSSTVYPYIAVFGAQAPSIYHGNKSLAIRREGEEDPNLVLDENKRRKVPHVPYVTKGIVAAANDWATTYRNKAFRFTPADPKFGGRGFSSAKARSGFVANPEFDGFYTRLRQWVYTGKDAVVRVAKRKSNAGEGADVDDEEMADAAPKKKTKFKFM